MRFKIGLITFAVTLAGMAFANQNASIIGYWQTIDKKTNQPSSLIQIWQKHEKYFGKVAKIYEENGHKVTDRCVNCKGVLRNKPILGLTIIRNISRDADGKYSGGKILDPQSGKDYHCAMTLADKGQQLRLRGYIGIPLLGRTDVWYRVNKVEPDA